MEQNTSEKSFEIVQFCPRVQKDKYGCVMSSNFFPHLIFKFGDLIEFSVLKD